MLTLIPEPLAMIWVGFVGACVGSFLNVVIARMPQSQSIVRPGSRCPGCREPIAWYDNIPILSFLLLRARCRRCNTAIAWRYPLVELLMAALSLALWARFGFSWNFLLWWPLGAALLAITFLDIDHWWVPDVITFPCMLWALVLCMTPAGIGIEAALFGLLPALGMWGVGWSFEKLTGREGLGLGDVKLLVVVGLALGPMGALTVLVLGSFQGALGGILVLLTGGHHAADESEAGKVSDDGPEADSKSETDGAEQDDDDDWVPHPRAIPFGPFLVLGAFEVVLLPHVFGDSLARLSLLLADWAVGG